MRAIRKELVEIDTYLYTLGPEIPLLDVQSRKMLQHCPRRSDTEMSTTALLVVAECGEQPKCPLTGEWMPQWMTAVLQWNRIRLQGTVSIMEHNEPLQKTQFYKISMSHAQKHEDE